MFETTFGNGKAKEFFEAQKTRKTILITQENLLEKYRYIIPDFFTVECIDNIEEDYMNGINSALPQADIIVGFGGGMSIDGAKYIAWQRSKPCVLIPTAISVDACYSYPIALRENSVVVYKGEVIPQEIIVDYDIIRSAPVVLNLSGVGDVLSCYTALFDWRLMSDAGKGVKTVERQYNGAQKLLDELFANQEEIRKMSDKGIGLIMNAYKWVGTEGYKYRYCHFEEGSEHYLAYTVESVCSKHLLHGRLVCMCAYIMSKLQAEGRQKAVADFTNAIGLSINPETVGLTFDELEQALRNVNDFSRENRLSYSVLNEKTVTEQFISEVIGELKEL